MFSHEHITQGCKNTSDRSAMNSDIRSVYIAQGLVDSMAQSLANVPSLSSVNAILRNGEPQFERHVEPRRNGRLPVPLHSGEIMNRVGALIDEAEDSIQPALACGYF